MLLSRLSPSASSTFLTLLYKERRVKINYTRTSDVYTYSGWESTRTPKCMPSKQATKQSDSERYCDGHEIHLVEVLSKWFNVIPINQSANTHTHTHILIRVHTKVYPYTFRWNGSFDSDDRIKLESLTDFHQDWLPFSITIHTHTHQN